MIIDCFEAMLDIGYKKLRETNLNRFLIFTGITSVCF